MRGQEIRAVSMITLLKQLGIKSADDMTVVEACTQYARIQRAAWSSRRPMGLQELVARGQKKRRAKITHPGKRGR